MQTQHANVPDPGNAATGDHRYISRARQIDGRFDIAAFKESVASDIGEEQGRHASILEPARHIGNGHVGSLRPAFRRDEAVARIDSHHDPARNSRAASFTNSGSLSAAVPITTRDTPRSKDRKSTRLNSSH